MARFYSYESMLRRVMEQYKPKRVLEYGPGRSTEIILEYPVTYVLSIEHVKTFYDTAMQKVGDDERVHLRHIPWNENYVDYPASVGERFDLVFIDGLCDLRVACLKFAPSVLSENGVVMLHDSERRKYDEGRALYETVEEFDGTALLKPKENWSLCIQQNRS